MTLFDFDKNFDAFLVVTQKNRRYFTRFDSTFGYLILTKDRKIFLTDSRYFEMAQESNSQGVEFELDIVGRYDLKDKLNEIFSSLKVKNIAFEDNELTFAEVKSLKETLKNFNLVEGGNALTELKKYKNDYEVECIEKAQKITDKVFSEMLATVKEGMTEKELSVQMQCLMLKYGAEKNSFDPIVSFGENTSKPHAHPTDRKLKKGDNVLLDFGCVVGGYCSDMTRTFFFGEPDEKIKKVYEIVKEAQIEVLNNLKCGMTCREAYEIAQKVFEKYNVQQNFTHALGHGVGIDIHETPSLHPLNNDVLRESMIVTVEPGLYFPKLGGVRIEDMVLICGDCIKNLTKSPKDIIIIK